MSYRICFAALLLAGCASQQPLATSPADPANPAAIEAPASAVSGTLVIAHSPATAAAHAAGYFTCVMHPQIHQDHPGKCPICGMELVEKTAPATESSK